MRLAVRGIVVMSQGPTRGNRRGGWCRRRCASDDRVGGGGGGVGRGGGGGRGRGGVVAFRLVLPGIGA